MKEYWNKAEQLRKRIRRKIHEIRLLRERAEGMSGSGLGDMPRTVSPERCKMESAVFRIMALEEEIRETQKEYDALVIDMERRINAVQDDDARDLLTKRYVEFKSWNVITAEFGYSVHNIYRIHAKALEKLRVCESS